ncbi:hypothetical protein SAMN05518801_13217 [Novosphingobium sp. CF614]|nr:hypothetical protein SAMN05518801_13217 [Novosphingobium sp. CF614]
MTRILQIAFWLAVGLAFTMATLPHPPDLPVPASDKAQHMMAFATLALIGSLAYRGLPRLALVIGLAAFGALIEVMQMVPALHRDAEFLDVVADSAAILIVTVLIAAVRCLLASRRRPWSKESET